MAEYRKSEQLRQLAWDVMQTQPKLKHLAESDCRIALQYSDQEKKKDGKTVYADTERVKDKLKLFIPYDFIVTFYEPNTFELSDEAMARLMYHELLHIGYDNLSGECRVIPHDVEDFMELIDNFGFNWIDI